MKKIFRPKAFQKLKTIKKRLEFHNNEYVCYALARQKKCPYLNEECSNCTQGFHDISGIVQAFKKHFINKESGE